MPAQAGRRAFLTSSLGGSLTAAIAAVTGCKPPPERSAAPSPQIADGLTVEHVAAAERLAGIEYTPAERHMIVDSIADQLSLLEARRTFMPEDDLAPATVFDPRLPGFAGVVQRLHDAGAVLVAKLTLGALAYGDVWDGGRTNNPWNLAEGSSGSSAGSAAATAAGLVGFAIGSETIGSIISPSMRTGVCGLRPSFGRVARYGAMAVCWSLDKLGPLCRTVEDTALVLAAINHHDPRDPSSLDIPFGYDGEAHDPTSLAGVRIGYDPSWFAGEDEALDRDALERLRALGAELVELELDPLPYAGLSPILMAEAAAAFEQLTVEDRDDLLDWQTPEAWPNTFRLARFIPAVDLLQADRLRRRVLESIEQLFARTNVALLCSPSFAGPLLTVTNFTGHPSLTLRIGFQQAPTRTIHDTPVEPLDPARHRVPYGITLWGRLFDEATLIRVGRALETALNVAHERPPGF